MLHITSAEYLEEYRVLVEFNDGTTGIADFSQSLEGNIFLPLRDRIYFRTFQIEGHTLSWSNGADFAPEYVRLLTLSPNTASSCVLEDFTGSN